MSFTINSHEKTNNPEKYSSETIVLKNAMFNISYMINRILVY